MGGLAALTGALIGWGTAACPTPNLDALEPPTISVPDTLPSGYERLPFWRTDVDLGVGHLRFADHAWGWLAHIRLPLFDAPGGAPQSWILHGWRADPATGETRPYRGSGLLETAYEVRSIIVHERRADGWMRIRLDAFEADPNGQWVHECLLSLGDGTLAFESWEDRLLADDHLPPFFRVPGPHPLRVGPADTAERLALIPDDPDEHALEPLAVRGDWMRVRVTLPRDVCAGPDAVERRGRIR